MERMKQMNEARSRQADREKQETVRTRIPALRGLATSLATGFPGSASRAHRDKLLLLELAQWVSVPHDRITSKKMS